MRSIGTSPFARLQLMSILASPVCFDLNWIGPPEACFVCGVVNGNMSLNWKPMGAYAPILACAENVGHGALTSADQGCSSPLIVML